MAKLTAKVKTKAKAKRPSSRAPKHEPAVCPCCGTKYPDRDPATERVYKCAVCGRRGFDCCVPGNNTFCSDCED